MVMVVAKSGGGVRVARSSSTVAERTEKGRKCVRKERKKMKREDAIAEFCCYVREKLRVVVLCLYMRWCCWRLF